MSCKNWILYKKLQNYNKCPFIETYERNERKTCGRCRQIDVTCQELISVALIYRVSACNQPSEAKIINAGADSCR